MSNFVITDDVFVAPTPAGAFHAVADSNEEPARKFLRNLMRIDATPELSRSNLLNWAAMDDEDEAMNLLYHLQELGWVEGLSKQESAETGPLDGMLPDLLGELSVSRKGLLADSQGFYVAANRIPHEVAEELSALSADIASLHERRSSLLINNMGLGTGAWSLVDAGGNSQIGFWPLYVGTSRFALVLGSEPRLNQPAFTQLIWALSIRYGQS